MVARNGFDFFTEPERQRSTWTLLFLCEEEHPDALKDADTKVVARAANRY